MVPRDKENNSMRLKPRLGFLLAAVAVACGMAVPPALGDDRSDANDRFTVRKGLTYSEADEGLRLDLFLPKAAGRPVPCIIVIQGGGFLAQNGQRFRPFAEHLAEHGMAAALIAYRGRPDHTYRDTLADVKAAVRFVREVGGQYNIAVDRIGAMGRSAGGTLSALLAVTGGMQEFEGTGGHSKYSSRIQAAVAYAGVFDFVSRFTQHEQMALQPRYETKMETNGEWIGTEFSRDDPDWIAASAVRHVDKGDPPILFLHCKDDATVPWMQSRDMYAKMREAGIASRIKYYEKGGHGFKNLAEEPMAEMVKFFRETLGRH
jgi:acetyl esterase/lipase